ncbi:hypothetical protein GQX74_015391 [Glossina fuscipes]|nr:hypothetical protein GQX74_015391 [Glossina fuscipes]
MKLIDNRYHQKSRTSLVSSSDGGILAEGETSSETSRGSEDSPPCDLGLVERLLLTHPVWFLPGIQRSGAVHFLQGKEEGPHYYRHHHRHYHHHDCHQYVWCLVGGGGHGGRNGGCR